MILRTVLFLLVAIGATPGKAGEAIAPKATLSVRVTGVRSDQGGMMLALFNSKETFTKTAFRHATVPVSKKSVEWKVGSLPPGQYSIALFHDANGNGYLDKSFFGIPKEDHAFSRGAKATFGPPKWEAAAFHVCPGDNQQTISLNQK